MTRTRSTNIVVTAAITLLGLAVLFPFYWMLRSSVMSNIEIYRYPPLFWPGTWRLENYPVTLKTFPFLRYILNTLTIAVPAIAGTLLTSTIAAYAFARLQFPLKRMWFTLVI
ncbi:MAG TPA: carbohydrate ABC transporter permease, partial [Spirochaetia bacterium]|nr:carbohydrate ABC transporter permease [Spirochaetia bacterium]